MEISGRFLMGGKPGEPGEFKPCKQIITYTVTFRLGKKGLQLYLKSKKTGFFSKILVLHL